VGTGDGVAVAGMTVAVAEADGAGDGDGAASGPMHAVASAVPLTARPRRNVRRRINEG